MLVLSAAQSLSNVKGVTVTVTVNGSEVILDRIGITFAKRLLHRLNKYAYIRYWRYSSIAVHLDVVFTTTESNESSSEWKLIK
jgi:hypothetical protein